MGLSMTSSASDCAEATLIDEEIARPDTEPDVFQKILEHLEAVERTLAEQGALLQVQGGNLQKVGKDLTEIKRRLRVMETNLEFVRQSQLSEAGRLTRLEADCDRCPGKYTPLPGISPDAESTQDCREDG
jgi:tetrahydromethanopterin S-methyltransferase subunit G